MLINERKSKLPSRLLFLSFLFIFLFSFVSSIPLTQQNINNQLGLQIFYTPIEQHQQNTPLRFEITVLNISTSKLVPNTNINCSLLLQDKDGYAIGEIPFNNYNTYELELTIPETNFTDLGEHSWKVYCIGGVDGVDEGNIEITPTGLSNSFYFIFLVLTLFLGLCFYGVHLENPWVTLIGCFGLCILGIYTSINGVDVYKNEISQIISYIVLAIGLGMGFESLMEITNL